MPPDPASPDLLLGAVRQLLRPLVRLLIRRGATFPVVAELLRGLYAEVARDMLPDERARTDSRLSLMTGIHRKELRRHREAASTPPREVPLGSQVVGRWLAAPGLQDEGGQPLPLPRAGAPPSFEALVEAVTRDIRPRAVLDDWLDTGLVALDGEGRVVLQARAFLPRPGQAEQLFFFGRNLHDHLAAAAANVEGDPPPFLERAVHYDGLSEDAARRLEAAGREAASRMLLDVNRTALAIAEADDRDAGARERQHRVNLGAFVYRNPGA